jgi:hypothetical protein
VRKAFTVIVLVLSLLHHGLAMAGNGVLYHAAAGLAHALLHWEKAGHHHHDDGAVHEDHSDESRNHVVADGALGVVGLAAVHPLLAAYPLDYSPVAIAVAARAAPFLEGPTRPPRLTA